MLLSLGSAGRCVQVQEDRGAVGRRGDFSHDTPATAVEFATSILSSDPAAAGTDESWNGAAAKPHPPHADVAAATGRGADD